MLKTLEAIFDGKSFLPQEPVELEPNTQVTITIETHAQTLNESKSFFKTARGLKLDGPTDWSERFEEYRYGPEGG